MADGLYEQIVFDGDRAPTLAAIEPRLKPRTLTVSGVAKAYAMMGWRIGYAAGPAALIREMIKIPVADHVVCLVDQPGRRARSTRGTAGFIAGTDFDPARQARPLCRDGK